jgi:hypothetical protein
MSQVPLNSSKSSSSPPAWLGSDNKSNATFTAINVSDDDRYSLYIYIYLYIHTFIYIYLNIFLTNIFLSGVDSPSNGSIVEDPNIPRMILITRVANLILSVCMIVAALLSLLTTDNATTGVLACYVVVFSCLLCCFETHLKQISKLIAFNFGFLYSAKSRSVFMIFIGTILFSFSLFGKIIGCLMLGNAGFNIYVLYKYPGYDDAQRNDAQSEIKDFLSSNPGINLSIYIFIYMYIYLYIYLYISISVYICISVILFKYLNIYLFII